MKFWQTLYAEFDRMGVDADMRKTYSATWLDVSNHDYGLILDVVAECKQPWDVRGAILARVYG